MNMIFTVMMLFFCNYQYTENNIAQFQKYNRAIILLNENRPAKWARWCIQDADMEIVDRLYDDIYIVRWIEEKPNRNLVVSSVEKLFICESIDTLMPDRMVR